MARNYFAEVAGSEPRLVTMGAEKILVARVDRPIPDPVNDLKPIAVALTLEDLRHIDYIVLVGKEKAIKVDASIAHGATADRSSPEEVAQELGEGLERDYGVRIVDRGSHQVIAVRIPRSSVAEFDESDGKVVKERLGAFELERGQILSVYLLADQDHVRIRPGKVFDEMDGKEHRDEIILGSSPQELLGLLASRLRKHQVIRDAVIVDGSGVEYPIDLIARGPSTILARYAEESSEDEVRLLGLLCRAAGAHAGILMVDRKTREGSDLVQVLTVDDL